MLVPTLAGVCDLAGGATVSLASSLARKRTSSAATARIFSRNFFSSSGFRGYEYGRGSGPSESEMAGVISSFVVGTTDVGVVGGRPLPTAGIDNSGCLRSAEEGAPRRSTGRLGSSSADGATGGAGADATGPEVGAGVVGAGEEPVEVGFDPPGGAVCADSGDLGFSGPPRLNTGGPSTDSDRCFGGADFLLAAAASSLADCQVPSPIQVLFACSAPVTVNNP